MSASKFGLYWRTLKYLKPVQLTNRIRRQFVKPKPVARPTFAPSPRTGVWTTPIVKPASLGAEDRFCFLNRTEMITGAEGWNHPDLPKLWLYNLHYHDGLCSGNTPAERKLRLVERWIAENPFGYGNGWEPYPISLRIVNWVKWRLAGGVAPDGMDACVYQQAHVLSLTLEYHLLGNHLFANAKALIFAGLHFEGRRPLSWLEKGLALLMRELTEQFLPDGAHFELSTTYHATLTEDLLDLCNILQAYGHDIPEVLVSVAGRAMAWLDVMTRPDGLSPLFNDAAYGICPTFGELESYAERLCVVWRPTRQMSLTDLPDSGYFRYDGAAYNFWGDAGQIGPDYIPGHAHCDMFNFELFAHGRPVVVDTGTSTYDVGARRTLERSTASHNTVQLGHHEQSEIWGAFRVGRRARITERHVAQGNVEAMHDGFKRLGVLHRRSFQFGKDRILLEDRLTGNSAGQAVARFHLHPDREVSVAGDTVQTGGVAFSFSGASSIDISGYYYAPEFNKQISAKCIEVHFSERLRTDIQI
ncbi:heparinase II/III family protein [Kordiimonas sp.]|uniref:heparinase II/III family protein n=1 Tax=Kordiimonas sp. TaxID=1970157 RepID=UPI003A900206